MRIMVLGWLIATNAAAFTVKSTSDGSAVRWGTFPVSYEWSGSALSDTLPEAPLQVEDAFDAWADVDETEIAFRSSATRQAPSSAPDSHNLVWFESDWPFDPDQIAMTDLWTDEEGKLVAFDIHINGTVPWSTEGKPEAYDLQAAVLHEVGHALGLEHSAITTAAMYNTTELGAVWRRELHEDDVHAAQFLYPIEAKSPSNGLQSLLMSCNTVPSSFNWIAPLVVASALCRRVEGAR